MLPGTSGGEAAPNKEQRDADGRSKGLMGMGQDKAESNGLDEACANVRRPGCATRPTSHRRCRPKRPAIWSMSCARTRSSWRCRTRTAPGTG